MVDLIKKLKKLGWMHVFTESNKIMFYRKKTYLEIYFNEGILVSLEDKTTGYPIDIPAVLDFETMKVICEIIEKE